MTIKEIRVEHITQPSSLSSLLPPNDEFVPYWRATITTDRGAFWGEGDSPEAAEEEAMRRLRHALALEADKARADYNSREGAGTIHIA